MPTATSDTATRSGPLPEDGDALDEAYSSFARSEVAAEKAISETARAVSELVWAVVPGVFLQPARTFDLALQLGEQAIQLQRRLLHELIVNLQVPMMRVLTDTSVDAHRNGDGSASRANNSGGGSRRRASTQS